jgi:hypothetical protein
VPTKHVAASVTTSPTTGQDPVQVPAQPRTRVVNPFPQVALQLVQGVQGDQAEGVPTEQSCDSFSVAAIVHVPPHAPAQVRVRPCEPLPQVVLQPAHRDHGVQAAESPPSQDWVPVSVAPAVHVVPQVPVHARVRDWLVPPQGQLLQAPQLVHAVGTTTVHVCTDVFVAPGTQMPAQLPMQVDTPDCQPAPQLELQAPQVTAPQ